MVGHGEIYKEIKYGDTVHYECPVCAKSGEKVMIMIADISENPPWITAFKKSKNCDSNNIPYCPECDDKPKYKGESMISTTHEHKSVMSFLV